MVLFVILFLTVFFVANHSFAQAIEIYGREYWGMLAVISFFFRLRVFDEIKDYRIDSLNHPHRVLQSGKIQLKHLIWLSVLGGIIEIGWSFWMSAYTFWAWVLVFGYSVLMRYEFFAGNFLKRYLLLYAISHLLIMPLIIAWIWIAYTHFSTHLNLYLLALLSLWGGFSFEIARKIHSPAAESPTIDSYSKSLGYLQSILLVLCIALAGVATQFYLLYLIQASIWSYIGIALLLGVIGFLYVTSLNYPQETQLRKNEIWVSLFMVLSYISIMLEIIF